MAFGSCLHPWEPQPVWQGVGALAPDAFVFLGDNVYADKGDYADQSDPERIQNAYRDLAASPEFQRFRARADSDGTRLLATWDDHDYGENDGGADYPHRLQSKRYFVEFFSNRASANRRNSDARTSVSVTWPACSWSRPGTWPGRNRSTSPTTSA